MIVRSCRRQYQSIAVGAPNRIKKEKRARDIVISGKRKKLFCSPKTCRLCVGAHLNRLLSMLIGSALRSVGKTKERPGVMIRLVGCATKPQARPHLFFFRLTCQPQHFLSDLTSVSLSSPSHLADVAVGCLGFGGSEWGRNLGREMGLSDSRLYNRGSRNLHCDKNSLRSLALQRSRLSVWSNPQFHHWRSRP